MCGAKPFRLARYILIDHQEKVRPQRGREGGLGYVRRDYVQDERYIAMEHMDVRRDWFSFAQGLKNRRGDAAPTG
jgi:hypothetical protein